MATPRARPPRARPRAVAGWPKLLAFSLSAFMVLSVLHSLLHAPLRRLSARAAANATQALAGAQPLQQAAVPQGASSRPDHTFLIFFSGHQGSSAIADMLGSLPDVLVPGFEPLDGMPQLSAQQKLGFLEAAFAWPAHPLDFWAWRAALTPLRQMRVHRQHLERFEQLAGKRVCGFKLRPYDADWGGRKAHTAMAGMDRSAVKALLERRGVRVLLTLRRNALQEALSWYRARDMGLSQFSLERGANKGSSIDADEGVGKQEADKSNSKLLPGPVAVNVTRLQGWLAYVEHANAALLEAAELFGRPTLTVWYEDFLADPASVIQQAAEFVGAASPLPGYEPVSKFRKASTGRLRDDVANFEELCVALQGTKYFAFLGVESCGGAKADQLGTLLAGSSGGTAPHQPRRQQQPAAQGAQQAVPLLEDWCPPGDKAATGWQALSSAECMARQATAQEAAAARVRNGTGLLLFKHVHKAGGTSMCRLAQRYAIAEVARLPGQPHWDTNCVPVEAFLGPHPAVGGGLLSGAVLAGSRAGAAHRLLLRRGQGGAEPAPGWAGEARSREGPEPEDSAAAPELNGEEQGALPAVPPDGGRPGRRLASSHWLGGACFFGFLTPPQLRALPAHYAPLSFVASEGALPDALPLDLPFAMVTMLRRPLDRVLSSWHWWRYMLGSMPGSPVECRAYWAPPNATLEDWLSTHYPDNWMTRELVGASALHARNAGGMLRALGPADLALAKQRLHAHAAVLVLEEWGSSMLVMEERFGWQGAVAASARAGSARNSDAERELAGQPSLLRVLRERNALDVQLYDYALALHRRQVEEAARGGLGQA